MYRLILIKKLIFILSFAFVVSCSQSFAVNLLVGLDGQLYGAQNVLVGTNYYNVIFTDGTAQDLFSVDGVYTFTFTAEEAMLAAHSLNDQVFIDDDSFGYTFDSVPNLTNGIESDQDYAIIYIPYNYDPEIRYSITNVLFWNHENVDSYSAASSTPATRTTAGTDLGAAWIVYSVWTKVGSSLETPAAVPEPGALLLLGTGLVGLAGYERKKFRNKI